MRITVMENCSEIYRKYQSYTLNEDIVTRTLLKRCMFDVPYVTGKYIWYVSTCFIVDGIPIEQV